MRPRTGTFIAFVILLVIFLFQNRQTITIEFLFFETDISGSLFIFLAALISFLVGFIVGRVTDDNDKSSKRKSGEADATVNVNQ
jgi:uncharacterized integral membrane protein